MYSQIKEIIIKIIFFGDSITDSSRERGTLEAGRVTETYSIIPRAYSSGFVFLTASQLFYEKPNYYQILNRGIAGDRLPQLYARIQLDVWNENPDVLSIRYINAPRAAIPIREILLRKGHNYSQSVISPTCTTQGYTQYNCTYCDHSYTSEYVSALGHNYVPTPFGATCTDKGGERLAYSI